MAWRRTALRGISLLTSTLCLHKGLCVSTALQNMALRGIAEYFTADFNPLFAQRAVCQHRIAIQDMAVRCKAVQSNAAECIMVRFTADFNPLPEGKGLCVSTTSLCSAQHSIAWHGDSLLTSTLCSHKGLCVSIAVHDTA